MAKAAKKKAAKKAATTRMGNDEAEPIRQAVIKLLLRKTGVTGSEIKETGFDQAASAALRMAERRGLKVRQEKETGDVTHYFATGTPVAPVRKASVKKAGKKTVKKAAKKVAKKRAKKPAAETTEAAGVLN